MFSQRKWLKARPGKVEDTGHVWDGDLREMNNPVPRWWTMMYVLMCLFGVGYLVLYPGLGGFEGRLGYSSASEVKQDQAALEATVKPIYARFAKMDIPQIAADPEAHLIGERLFMSNCAQCHGSDAKGSTSFPNLVDGDSIYGRQPEILLESITRGRNGVMPSFASTIDAGTAGDIAQYVRSLSGLAHDQIRIVRGKREYMNSCAACHGPEGKGNKILGAPNLADEVWLYGSSEAAIVRGILNGRNNRMPAQSQVLTADQIRLVAAWVWGLSKGMDATSAGAGGNSSK
jgi:cytochrome c oxidase cbb3-type subunit 3